VSTLLAVISTVQATATPVAQAIATVTPSPSPAVTAHAQTITDTVNQLASKISTTDLLVAAGVITTGVQYLVNHFKALRESINWILSFAIPFMLVAGASFASGHNDLHLAPVVYLLGQLLFFTIERIKTSVATTEPVATTPAQF
jgi:hypothetical protein